MTRALFAAVVALALSVSTLAPRAHAAPGPRTPGEKRAWLLPESTHQTAAPASGGSWRAGAVLLAAGGLLVGTWLARRMKKARVAELPMADITVLATKRVGPKSQVVIVETGGRVLLLGVSDSQISRLYRLRDLETKPKVAAHPHDGIERGQVEPAPATHGSRFAALLEGVIERRQHASNVAPADLLAGATRDVVRREARTPSRGRAPAIDDYREEQTSGLLDRLGGRPQ